MNNNIRIMIAGSLLCFSLPSAFAQSPYYEYSSFEGVYAGAYAGGVPNKNAVMPIGAMVGINISLNESILAGVEVQGGGTLSIPTTSDALILGRVGVEANDNVMLYSAIGAGFVNGEASFAIGGGVEFAVSEQLGFRPEAFGVGSFGSSISSSKLNLGLVWHVE